jgi:sulfite reductase (NADPH) hemoprotein beta-component
VYVPLKNDERPAGDLTDTMMDAIADIADRYALSELRTTHDQNLVLAHVARADLVPLWRELRALGLATPNLGHLTDMIVCPGLDFCSLANAGTLTLYDQVQAKFDDIDYLHDIGEIAIKVSGCMNACGHHHVGDIGILGVEKQGKEWYQLTLGGHAGNAAAIGKRLGRALPQDDVIPAIETLMSTYLEVRLEGESFANTINRVGVSVFKETVYAS